MSNVELVMVACMKSETFSAENFWPAFQQDLSNAQVRVITQSPFIASRRVMKLQHILSRMLERNVRLCVFLQAPNRYKSFPEWYQSLNSHEEQKFDQCDVCVRYIQAAKEGLAQTLTKARERRKILQRSLARASGVNQSTISRIELDEDGVAFGAVKKIAGALGFRVMAVPEWMAPSIVSIGSKTMDDE